MARRAGENTRYVLGIVFDNQLNELKDYIKTIEGALSNKFEEFDIDVERSMQEMSEERKNHYAEMMADDAFQLADRFPSMVRKTSFVFLYGLLEHSLLNLCEDVKHYGKLKESPTSGKDKGIIAYLVQICRWLWWPTRGKDKGITATQTYLKNVAKVEFPDKSKEWNEIKRMAEIRNVLSHRLGRIKGDPSKALKDYIKQKNGMLEVTGIGEIKFNAGYCEDVIEVVRKFFAAVLKAVPDELLSKDEKEEMDDLKQSLALAKHGNIH